MEFLEQKLLALLEKKPNIDLKELKRELKIKDEGDKFLEDLLFKCELNGLVYKNKNGTYCPLANKQNILTGKAHFLASGDLMVTDRNNYQVIIPSKDASGILEKDIICAKLLYQDNHGTVYGKLDKILRRHSNQVSCEVVFEGGHNALIPYNSKSRSKVRVDKRELDKHGVGEILLVKLNTYIGDNDGVISKIIGHRDEPDVDEKTIAYDHGFSAEFNSKVLKELEKIPTFVNAKEAIKEGRRDLRDKVMFTIDGADTKDIDDSVGIEVLPNGNYKLYVNIADVAHYIKPGTALDNAAFERGTSVYMNDTVMPMLPPKISNGICSLHPHVDRLTKTYEMIINPNGQVIDYDIYDSIINSSKKMTYEDVNEILINGNMVDGYEEFYDDLKTMHELSNKLNKVKKQRGFINFYRKELKAKGHGIGISFKHKEQKDAEMLIENFMLLANETAAKHFYFRGLPFLYRVHEEPDEDKIQTFISILKGMGYKFKSCKNITTNKYIQNIVDEITRNGENSDVLSEFMLINTMKRAKYSNINYRHFGLALQYYAQVTSPIRRYNDLQNQRLIDIYNKVDNFNYDDLNEYLKAVAEQCNKQSNEADKAEREAREMRVAEYMENHIGDSFEAVVSQVGQSSIKVRTSEGFNGTIDLNDMNDDNYKYDSLRNIIVGKNTGKTYSIGDKIDITVKDASKKQRMIKFMTGKALTKKKKRNHKK